MQAGKLHHKIQIVTQIAGSKDAYAKAVLTWPVFANLYANISPISGKEFEFAKSFGATVSHKINTHWIAGVNVKQKVLFNGRTFSINAVLNPEELNRELVLYCTEQIGV